MNLKTFFDKALVRSEFELLLDDKKNIHEHHYKKFDPAPEAISLLRSINSQRVLVITEPWCGDSLAFLPVLLKMGDINGNWDIRIALRSENEDLMNRFLTKGGKAIPVFLFMKPDYSLMFRWGPRPASAQKLFESYREKIDSGDIEMKDVHLKLRKLYAADRGNELMCTIIEELKNRKNNGGS